MCELKINAFYAVIIEKLKIATWFIRLFNVLSDLAVVNELLESGALRQVELCRNLVEQFTIYIYIYTLCSNNSVFIY